MTPQRLDALYSLYRRATTVHSVGSAHLWIDSRTSSRWELYRAIPEMLQAIDELLPKAPKEEK